MAAINTTQTAFTANETITSAKLNNILLQSKVDAGAVTTDGTITVVSGQIQVGTLKSANYPALGITNAAIANSTITATKLSQYAPKWFNGVTWVQSGLELGPEITSNGVSNIDFHSSFPVIDFDSRIIRNSGIDGKLEIRNAGTGSINFICSGGVSFADAPMPNPSGTAPIYGTRAWVNFDGSVAANLAFNYTRLATVVTVSATSHKLIVGNVVYLDFTTGGALDGRYTVTEVVDVDTFKINTVASGTIASGTGSILRRQIRESGNVSSVTYLNSTGDYFINFAIEMPDANYAMSGFANFTTTAPAGLVSAGSTQSVTQQGCDISVASSTAATGTNASRVSVMFIR